MRTEGSQRPEPDTLLDHLCADLRQRAQPVDGQAPPAAILWPDPGEEWRPLLGAVRERLPELVELGSYSEASRRGPAIWLRTVLEPEVEGLPLPDDRAPILYLPGVRRQDLRAGDECSDELKPLVELLYRGAAWAHPNGREWTVRAFLGSPKSLRLDVADDAASRRALLDALPEVAVMPLGRLRERRLDADFFHRRLSPDPVRDVLHWMGEGDALRERFGPERWDAFARQCRDELGFDPRSEPDVVAGERLGSGEGDWAEVWERFVQTPEAWPGVVDVLRRARPMDSLAFERERWPDLNEADEERLLKQLGAVKDLPHEEACRRLAELDGDHGARRGWVWARLGLAPLAEVLAPLARLAARVGRVLGGGTPQEGAAAYLNGGWEADRAAREALASAPLQHAELVGGLVRSLLLPWQQDSAQAFQAASAEHPLPLCGEQRMVEAAEGECLVFVDGLRYELGRDLAESLDAAGCSTEMGHRWAACPTVTATAKPAVTPVAGRIAGNATLGGDFAPSLTPGGQPVNARSLRAAIEEAGYQLLDSGALEPPLGASSRGWVESGKIDTLGHELAAADFARRLPEELDDLTKRIVRLLELGWKSVRVVTDHGWLLMPGGLPKVELPQHLTVSRGARCAVISGESQPDALTAPWHWNGDESFAAARGIGAFRRSVEYAHGSFSLQECLIPDLRARRAEGASPRPARIRTVTWRGFRCLVEASAEPGAAWADLRLKEDLRRSVARACKPLEEDGSASLLLADDEHEDARLALVLVDKEGRVLDRRQTAVGENS